MAEKKDLGIVSALAILVLIIILGVVGVGLSNKPDVKSTPQVAKTEEKKSVPITLSGTGQTATQKFTLHKGLAVFKMTHAGEGNFGPFLMQGDGTRVELLANEVGNFSGSKALPITHTGEFLLDVTADGAWTITIEQ